MEKLTYHQRLRILELNSLGLRCVRADLLFTYKLVFGLIDASVGYADATLSFRANINNLLRYLNVRNI